MVDNFHSIRPIKTLFFFVCYQGGALDFFVSLASTTAHVTIRKEAFWSLSNICAGSGTQIQMALDGGVIQCARQATNDPSTPYAVRFSR